MYRFKGVEFKYASEYPIFTLNLYSSVGDCPLYLICVSVRYLDCQE